VAVCFDSLLCWWISRAIETCINLLPFAFTDVHFAQILTYLKLGNYPLGLLINFDSKILKNNIKRFINTLWNSASPLCNSVKYLSNEETF
jgi:hypothetical protein